MTTMVSVVIACRNAETTLGVQLEALTRQDCSVAWDVVISDNGSTDGTVALARSYASRLPGLSIVDSSAKAGPGYARNVGAWATHAPLLAFCDADDEAAPGWLDALVRALKKDPFVAGRFEAGKLNDARVLRSRPLQQSDRLQESPFGPDLPHAGAGNLGVSRELFFSVGGFDPAVGCLEDTDFCWRLQRSGVPLVFCPEAVMHVRLRSSLRAMWAQGRAYGQASALLTHRYGTQADSADTHSASVDSVARRLGRLITLVRQQDSPGGLLWSLSWHLGHRQWQRMDAPAVPQAVGPRRRQAS